MSGQQFKKLLVHCGVMVCDITICFAEQLKSFSELLIVNMHTLGCYRTCKHIPTIDSSINLAALYYASVI